MLELAALGLLLKDPLHGYRLKQQLEMFMSGVMSVNYGAIYPLLKRLEAQNHIETLAEEGDAGLSRKVYQITPKGRERWRQAMLTHPHESWANSRSRFIIKFFFFSRLEADERIKLINHRLMTCQLRLESQESKTDFDSPEDPYPAIAYQRHLANLRFEIEWLQEQLQREQLNLSESNRSVLPRNS